MALTGTSPLTLIGYAPIFRDIKEALEKNDLPTHCIRYYNPSDPLHEIAGGWLRDCRVAAIHGEPHSYVPCPKPPIITHYPCTRDPFIVGTGAWARHVIASKALNASQDRSLPYISGIYTCIEGGNCLKLLVPQPDGSKPKVVAIIGFNSLWLSHQVASENNLFAEADLFNHFSISRPVDYQTLQIVKQINQGHQSSKMLFSPDTDYELYIDKAVTYAQQQELVLKTIKTDLCVDEVICIEQFDCHIDLRCFTFCGVFFMHSTKKTLELLSSHLELNPKTRRNLSCYYKPESDLILKLISAEERNKYHLEKQGIEVVELCGVLESPTHNGEVSSFMNVVILPGDIIVSCGCDPSFNFLKFAFEKGIRDRFPDVNLIFTEETFYFEDMQESQGGFRCASTEISYRELYPEKLPQELILDKTHTLLYDLPRETSLKNLFDSMHELNITWHADLRKRILVTYNDNHSECLLPVDWDAASELLDKMYIINKDKLINAFIRITSTLPLQDAL